MFYRGRPLLRAKAHAAQKASMDILAADGPSTSILLEVSADYSVVTAHLLLVIRMCM